MHPIHEHPRYRGPTTNGDQSEVRDARLFHFKETPESVERIEMMMRAEALHDAVRQTLRELGLPVLRSSFRPKSRASIQLKLARVETRPIHDLYGVRLVTLQEQFDPTVQALTTHWPFNRVIRAPGTHSVNGFTFPRVQIVFDGRRKIGEIQVLTPELEAEYEATRAAYEAKRAAGAMNGTVPIVRDDADDSMDSEEATEG